MVRMEKQLTHAGDCATMMSGDNPERRPGPVGQLLALLRIVVVGRVPQPDVVCGCGYNVPAVRERNDAGYGPRVDWCAQGAQETGGVL
jgi:hypothetical protein